MPDDGALLVDELADARVGEIQQAVDDVNAHMARVEQIKKFTVLPRELSIADGELTPTDVTPEATRLVLERDAPGIAEAVRRYGAPTVPTAVLSRGLAGTAGRTLVVNLPGSTGGVRDGLAVLGPLLPHIVSQLRGGDHPRA